MSSMERIPLTSAVAHISLGTDSNMIIQNRSGCPILWSVAENSTEFFILYDKETVIVDYDIYAKELSAGSYLTVGKL